MFSQDSSSWRDVLVVPFQFEEDRSQFEEVRSN